MRTPAGLRWGPRGAAGLLLVHDGRYLLTLRSEYVHQPGVWSLPGGAIEPGETPEDAAARETLEELGGVPSYDVRRLHVERLGRWSYTTVYAETTQLWQPPRLGWETSAASWFTGTEVVQLPLHPGLASCWPRLLEE